MSMLTPTRCRKPEDPTGFPFRLRLGILSQCLAARCNTAVHLTGPVLLLFWTCCLVMFRARLLAKLKPAKQRQLSRCCHAQSGSCGLQEEAATLFLSEAIATRARVEAHRYVLTRLEAIGWRPSLLGGGHRY